LNIGIALRAFSNEADTRSKLTTNRYTRILWAFLKAALNIPRGSEPGQGYNKQFPIHHFGLLR
jgi:hypothetical protein